MPRLAALAFDYAFHIAFSAPVRLHNYLLRCVPRMEPFQNVKELRCTVQGEKIKLWPYTFTKSDSFGNCVLSGMDAQEHTVFSVKVSGIVEHTPYRICDSAHGMYRVPSALTLCTSEMRGMLQAILAQHQNFVESQNKGHHIIDDNAYGMFSLRLDEAQNLNDARHMGNTSRNLFDLACAIAHAVHKRLRYVPKSTRAETAAGEAFALNSGVCQDFAHITIALCRMAGIPARYACGYITGEGESHAWVEVYIHGVWYGLDPTQNRLIHLGYIKVAHGRDSADCPMNRGNFCVTKGESCTQETTISVKVTSL